MRRYIGIGGLEETAKRGKKHVADAVFFQIGEKNPASIRGQTSVQGIDWTPNEMLVTEMRILHCDLVAKEAFAWSEPLDNMEDIQRLVPSDEICTKLIKFL